MRLPEGFFLGSVTDYEDIVSRLWNFEAIYVGLLKLGRWPDAKASGK